MDTSHCSHRSPIHAGTSLLYTVSYKIQAILDMLHIWKQVQAYIFVFCSVILFLSSPASSLTCAWQLKVLILIFFFWIFTLLDLYALKVGLHYMNLEFENDSTL